MFRKAHYILNLPRSWRNRAGFLILLRRTKSFLWPNSNQSHSSKSKKWHLWWMEVVVIGEGLILIMSNKCWRSQNIMKTRVATLIPKVQCLPRKSKGRERRWLSSQIGLKCSKMRTSVQRTSWRSLFLGILDRRLRIHISTCGNSKSMRIHPQ